MGKLRKIIGNVIILSMLVLSGCQRAGGSMITRKMIKIHDNTETYNKELGARSLLPIGKSRIHYRPSTGWLGDAHPMYKDGVWYLYYLDLPFNTPNRIALSGVRQGLAISTDLVHWEELNPTIDNTKRAWWAIANVKKDNQIYSMFNDVVTNTGYGLAKSDDFVNFVDYGAVYPYSYVLGDEARDPTLFYDEKEDLYYFIYGVKNNSKIYDNAQGKLYYSTTRDFQSFSEPKVLYNPDNASVTECPELFKIGKKYYLVMTWGTDRVGTARYRVSDSITGPWSAPLIDTIQTTEFMAPNSRSNGKEHITFGWIPTYKNNEDGNTWQWGGDLAFPLKLIPRKDHSLRAELAIDVNKIRADQTYDFARDKYDYVKGSGWYMSNKGFAYEEHASYGEVWLGGNHNYFEMNMDVTFGKDNRGFGVSFRTGNHGFNGYEIFIDPVTNTMHLRYHFERRVSLVTMPINIKPYTTMPFKLIVDGPIFEAYLNNEFAFSGRAHIPATRNAIGLFSEYGSAKFENINVFDLKRIYQ
ncbi:MAG: family 43 glycosylhydrolase [Bacilli bacterium]|jgi:beta-fructofuranosidase